MEKDCLGARLSCLASDSYRMTIMATNWLQ